MRILTFMLTLVLASSIGFCALVDVESRFNASLRPFTSHWSVHPILVLLVGIAIGASAASLVFAWLFRAFVPPDESEAVAEARPDQNQWLVATVGAVVATLGLLLLIAVGNAGVSPLKAGLLMILGTTTLIAGVHTFGLFARGDTLRFDSNWGGLGSSLGGWRISPASTMALLFLILLGATVASGLDSPTSQGKGETQEQSDSKAPDSPADKGD